MIQEDIGGARPGVADVACLPGLPYRAVVSGSMAEVSGWGPFFAVESGVAPGPPWRPVSELVADPTVLSDRVTDVGASLATSVRVAASVAHLGVAARLVAPSLAVAVHSGRFPAFDMWWRDGLGGAFPLAMSGRSVDSAVELLEFLERLVDAVAVFSVSRQVLWGNVASAVNGAAAMIGAARPDLASRAIALADELLDAPPLRGTGVRGADGRFRRRSCCLIYQASPGGGRAAVCGDCVLG
ncbi:MAG TPA: (2Fe-2S)-binding protein [Pseudonocardiaceae bacterium]